MKISDHKLDVLIRAASDELIEEDVNYAKSLDTSTTQISDKAIRRIRRNIKNYDKEPWWNSIPISCRKIVAAMLVLCTISFGLCLSVTAVRAEIMHTLIKYYDKFVAVFYISEETPPCIIEEFREPALQLNGKEKQTIVQADILHMIHYYGENGLEMEYQQLLLTDSSSDVDNKDCTIKEVQINGHIAQLFSYFDGRHTITWHDNDYAYIIFSYCDISSDLIIFLAESVE